ncbi:MAG: ISAzo13 family transposase [Ktedonobacteraceae bacterium]|nr:ISAzo13 family transposase [Ktedonobacteraceae bacterium]MBO0789476.1 ISAzo13 family transposase [Ktedonobacteraceae bacterium]
MRKLGYSLRVNVKKHEASSAHPDRQQQFEVIESHKQAFQVVGWPIISVDTKKKELIGNFKNGGQAWGQEAEVVNVHDFPHDALMRAVPYGIYDVSNNCGSVYVGSSSATPQFAVTALARWWQEEGRHRFPDARELLILADAGGSNGSRSRSFKLQLQEQLSDPYGLQVSVCHYPTGCSKWNPIEHRLFSQISRNWAGKPLRSLQTMLNYIRGTTTQAGLTVRAACLEGIFEKGQKVSDIVRLRHAVLGLRQTG